MPKLSIITINYNNAEGLKLTIKSVINQNSNDFEYIVIDGESTDNSKAIITHFDANIHGWISEPDRGVYEAMNKGIKKAKGEYLLFLNSGDYLYAKNSISSFLEKEFQEDIVIGDLLLKENVTNLKYETKIVPENITAKYLIFDYIPHPSTFIKRSLFKTIGLYNEHNKIVSDWEFFVKSFLLFNASYTHFKEIVSVFITDGLSANPKNQELIKKEKSEILATNYPYLWPDYQSYKKLIDTQKAFKNSYEYKAIEFLKKIKAVSFLVFINKTVKKIR